MPMADPNDLIDAIVTTLRSNSDLVTSLDSLPANIIPHYLDYNLGQANIENEQVEQPANTIMVFWLGTVTGTFSRMETIKHNFGIAIKPLGRVATLFRLIREGVCTVPSNMPFKLTCVSSSVRPPENMSCEPAGNFIAQGYGLYDSAIIKFTLTERGIDN